MDKRLYNLLFKNKCKILPEKCEKTSVFGKKLLEKKKTFSKEFRPLLEAWEEFVYDSIVFVKLIEGCVSIRVLEYTYSMTLN